MRTLKSVLRWLSAGLFALVLLLAAYVPVQADTGTYGISNYTVTLEPQSSGQVKITLEQQWKVLSGDIPWVTIGLPNNNFSIDGFSGAAAKVSSDNSSGFSGVRVDLDKDYKPGQTFAIKVAVLQSNLLERLTADKKWRINFTPGWYDRATIDHMQINLISPVDYQTYSSVAPTATSVNNNVITWDRLNLALGERFTISIESTDGSFLTATASIATGPSTWLNGTFFLVVGLAILLGLAFWGIRRFMIFVQPADAGLKRRLAAVEAQMAKDQTKKKQIEEGFKKYVEQEKIEPDEQGRYYDPGYNTYITPALWAASIDHPYHPHIPNTTTGGCVSSGCACACVSCACACACACAGGGAAGCSRKSLHECRTCSVLAGKVSETHTNASESP